MLQNSPQWVDEQYFIVRDILGRLPLKKHSELRCLKKYFAIWFYNNIFLSDPQSDLMTNTRNKYKKINYEEIFYCNDRYLGISEFLLL